MITLGLEIWGRLTSYEAAFSPFGAFGALAAVFGVVLILWGVRGHQTD